MKASYSIADEFNMMGFNSYNNFNSRPRIRSADFEQENDEWLRHTIERHQRESDYRSMDRRRAHSMPRKVHLNQGVGLLDGFPDLGRPELGARNTSSMGRAGMATSHSVFNYENPYDEPPTHFDPNPMRYGKEPPNIFDRLRSQENYSDYMFSDSGSLSSISSWGRRSPTRNRKQRVQQSKASNSYSMNDINFHQVNLRIYNY